MTHAQKVKLARKMRTPEEIRKHVPIFDTRAWNLRSKAIKKRLGLKVNVGHLNFLKNLVGIKT